MCMSGGGGGGDVAEENRRQEQERQRRIEEGVRRVNEIFEGAPIYEWQTQTVEPGDVMGRYTTAGGTRDMPLLEFQQRTGIQPSMAGPFTGGGQARAGVQGPFGQGEWQYNPETGGYAMGGRGFGGTGMGAATFDIPQAGEGGYTFDPATGQYTQRRQVQVGTTGGYGDPFFADIAKRYTDYYNPQLQEQYETARDQLTKTLARQGILQSSAGQGRFSDLLGEYQREQQQLTARGLGEAQRARADVEGLRSDLLSQVEAGMGGETAAAIARNRMAAMTQPKAYDPLGDVFQNVTGTLYSAAQAEKAGRQGLGGLGTRLFGAGGTQRGSGRVVT